MISPPCRLMAITCKQPMAQLAATGEVPLISTLSCTPDIGSGSVIAIHASKPWHAPWVDRLAVDHGVDYVATHGWDTYKGRARLARRAVVGLAVAHQWAGSRWDLPPRYRMYWVKCRAWVLTHPVLLPEPIPCQCGGRNGQAPWPLPPDIVAQITQIIDSSPRRSTSSGRKAINHLSHELGGQ
jgi:hypothetical protein